MYELLDRVYETIRPFGWAVAVAAWASVCGGAVGLGFFLIRRPWRLVRGRAAAAGAAALAAHLADYAVTLRVSPSLALEANPIWRVAVDQWGLPAAKLYGLTGKLLLSVLACQLAACYLLQRRELFPERASGFREFWRGFGRQVARRPTVDWSRLGNLFAFMFAAIGPFFFYVALQNALADSPWHARFPPLPLVLGAYLAAAVVAYVRLTWRAFSR